MTATSQGCQVMVGGDDISKGSAYPREAELLVKKCTRLILELLSFSPWVVKMSLWFFSALSGQVLRINNLFQLGENQISRNTTPPLSFEFDS